MRPFNSADHMPYHLVKNHQEVISPVKEGHWKCQANSRCDINAISHQRLLEICGRIWDNKIRGVDGMPNRALKVAIKSRPGMFAALFKACISERIFLAPWKLVLRLKAERNVRNSANWNILWILAFLSISQQMSAAINKNWRLNFWRKPRWWIMPSIWCFPSLYRYIPYPFALMSRIGWSCTPCIKITLGPIKRRGLLSPTYLIQVVLQQNALAHGKKEYIRHIGFPRFQSNTALLTHFTQLFSINFWLMPQPSFL